MRKRLIIVSVVLGLASFLTFAFLYEHYYRDPGQEILYGVWESQIGEWTTRLDFRSDSKFVLQETLAAVQDTANGKWYAGGTKIFLRYEGQTHADRELRRPVIMHIIDIEADAFRVQFHRDGDTYRFHRVHPTLPNASN